MLPVWSILIVLFLRCSGLTSNSCGFNSMCTCSSGQHDLASRSLHTVSCLSVPFYKFPNLPEGSIGQLEVAGAHAAFLEAETLAGCQVQALVLTNNRLQHVADRAFSSSWKSLTSLDLSYNQLDSVPFVALKEIRSLQWINMHGNQISSLEGEWSHMKNTVATLFLGENDVTEISSDSPDHASGNLHGLRQFKSLIWLNLDGNRIVKIYKYSLPPALQTFSVSHNLIETFPIDLVATLPQLQWLYLRGNHIKYLPEHTFPRRLWMEKIDLGENFLKSLPKIPFNNSICIRDLNLASNDFRTVTAESFTGLETRRIILSHNLIENLDPRAFNGLEETLEYLDFDHNNLQQIPKAVSELKTLKYLYLSSNRLVDIPENAFDNFCHSLKAVSLSGNRLNRIPWKALQNCSKISHFNVAFNDIGEINEDDFLWGAAIKSLNMGNNQIANLQRNTFKYLQELKELSLSFNPIRFIDKEAFNGLKTLESLELSFSLNPDVDVENIFEPLGQLRWLSIDNNNLHYIPENLLNSLKQLNYINLESNKLHALPKNLFKSNIELRHIRLSNNELRGIETETFSLLPNLESITLSGNKIKHIQRESFSRLPNLTKIILSDNFLTHISHDAFSNLPTVTKIDLQNNFLKEISFKFFVNITSPISLNVTKNRISFCTSDAKILNIETLDLSYNNLENVPNCLEHTASLKKLILESNSISSLDHNDFMHLTSLETLKLNANNILIVSKKAFFGLQNLQILDLSKNFISQMHNSQFVNMPKLRILNLKENRLSYLPRDIFSNTLLEMLDLGLNSFTVVPSMSISDIGMTLRYLSMRSNNIEHIDITTFPDVPSLQYLDLSNNKLTILPDNVFTSLGLLQYLDLSFNPLRSNFKELFHYAQSLKYLDLSNSWIIQTPFFPLPNLVHLNLSHNLIENIDKNSIQQLLKLKSFDISFNKLEEVPANLWTYLPNLKILNLSNNPIKEITVDSFSGLQNLQELILLNLNHIKKFEGQSISQIRVLNKLTIETWPKLDHFSDQFCNLLSNFDQLRILKIYFHEYKLDDQLLCITNRKIRELDISGKNLKTIDKDAFAKFVRNPDLVLKIHDTLIEDLPAGLFANMYRISYLRIDLRFNMLSQLSPDIFYGNTSGWRNIGTTMVSGGLILSDNPFRCGCHLAWLGHWYRRWIRESVQSHNAPVETAIKMHQMVKEATCIDSITSKIVPIIYLPPEDMSCHASALSRATKVNKTFLVFIVLILHFDMIR
ncbi:chaoptin-like [Diorhabda carinulata]|uniref:chaoptin-like n=1 Tax=Diorhabda carinulata TaxID=1163345 RepID=UPI0025A2004A|nr:chaoptin-like [Diorhabda carinulata]XP_057659375.1 chaoptin-like [Diorhabda carinulata]